MYVQQLWRCPLRRSMSSVESEMLPLYAYQYDTPSGVPSYWEKRATHLWHQYSFWSWGNPCQITPFPIFRSTGNNGATIPYFHKFQNSQNRKWNCDRGSGKTVKSLLHWRRKGTIGLWGDWGGRDCETWGIISHGLEVKGPPPWFIFRGGHSNWHKDGKGA